jgi:hypothetical protein
MYIIIPLYKTISIPFSLAVFLLLSFSVNAQVNLTITSPQTIVANQTEKPIETTSSTSQTTLKTLITAIMKTVENIGTTGIILFLINLTYLNLFLVSTTETSETQQMLKRQK